MWACADCGAVIGVDELVWVECCDGTCAESLLKDLDIDRGIACVYHLRCITPPWRRKLYRGRGYPRRRSDPD